MAAGGDNTWPTAFGVDGLPYHPFWSDAIRNWRTGWDIGACKTNKRTGQDARTARPHSGIVVKIAEIRGKLEIHAFTGLERVTLV